MYIRCSYVERRIRRNTHITNLSHFYTIRKWYCLNRDTHTYIHARKAHTYIIIHTHITRAIRKPTLDGETGEILFTCRAKIVIRDEFCIMCEKHIDYLLVQDGLYFVVTSHFIDGIKINYYNIRIHMIRACLHMSQRSARAEEQTYVYMCV